MYERQRCHRVLKLNHKLDCRLMSHVNSFKRWQRGQQSATTRMGGPENNKKNHLTTMGIMIRGKKCWWQTQILAGKWRFGGTVVTLKERYAS